jgi:hypothetical protein
MIVQEYQRNIRFQREQFTELHLAEPPDLPLWNEAGGRRYG